MTRVTRVCRRTRQSTTAVWYETAKVGTLTRATDGAISFTYEPTWLASEAAFPVASALPLSKVSWQGDPVVAAFDNLLPDAEGELREKIAARVGAQGKDVFSLLSVLGRDCVGALQFLPMDAVPAGQDMQYRIISEEEMVADLKNLAAAPLALGEDDDFRISIAGAQEKTAYLRIDGQWANPANALSTSRVIAATQKPKSAPLKSETPHEIGGQLL
ncbi:HipA N-terminal domain-containing protein [Roseicitreum antarcticum]|nr:HipA N-terminal domain-containing protein [Roseicitreum antarcticum]